MPRLEARFEPELVAAEGSPKPGHEAARSALGSAARRTGGVLSNVAGRVAGLVRSAVDRARCSRGRIGRRVGHCIAAASAASPVASAAASAAFSAAETGSRIGSLMGAPRSIVVNEDAGPRRRSRQGDRSTGAREVSARGACSRRPGRSQSRGPDRPRGSCAAVGAAIGPRGARGCMGCGASAQPTHGTCATRVRRGRGTGHHVVFFVLLSGAPQAVWGLGCDLGSALYIARIRARAVPVERSEGSGASVIEALDRAVAADR